MTDKKDSHFKKHIIWYLLGFFFIVYVLLMLRSPSDLILDEPFYFYQALQLTHGSFDAFENTQGVVFPLMLSILPKNVFMLRFANVIVSIFALFLLFRITKKQFGQTAAILATAIVGANPFYIGTTTLLFTEPLFFALFLLATEAVLNIDKTDEWKDYILLGVYLGLAMETRATGFIIAPLMLAYVAFRKKEIFTAKLITTAAIIGILALPYFLLGGVKFIVDKTGTGSFSLNTFLWALKEITVPVALLALLGMRKKDLLFAILPLGIIFVFVLTGTAAFPRHFLPALPFLGILAAHRIMRWDWISKVLFVAVIIMYALNISAAFSDTAKYGQEFVLEVPSTCVEIQEWKYENGTLILPFFSQPSGTILQYNATFELQEPLHVLIVEYLDDKLLAMTVNDKNVPTLLGSQSGYDRKIYYVDTQKGENNITLTIQNWNNIGGVGQAILCPDYDTFAATRKVFVVREDAS